MVAQYSSAAPGTAPCRTCFLSVDQLGSTRLVTDIGASVVGRHDYVPFGQEIPGGWAGRNSDWGANDSVNQKFTGQERDADTNIDYFKARYYGSLQGRFISPDPYAGSMDISNPQSFNRYAYVLGNPLGLVDPSGMFVEQNPTPPDNGDDGGDDGNDNTDCLICWNIGYPGSGRPGGGNQQPGPTTQLVQNVGQRVFNWLGRPRNPTCLTASTAAGASMGAAVGMVGVVGGPAVAVTEPTAMLIGGGAGWLPA